MDAFATMTSRHEAADRAYAKVGGTAEYESDSRTVIVDAIADLLHLSDRLGLDTPAVLESATTHYFGEKED